MPELPEVETVCRGLAPHLEGRVLTRVVQRRPDLRFPFPPKFCERLTGRRVAAVRRRAKYILMHLDDGTVLLAHLGMSGRMVISPAPAPEPATHDHVIFETDEGTVVTFNDARRFGMMDLTEEGALAEHPMLRSLGPEPLGNDFSGPVLAERLAGRMSPIKAVLLDQTVVAGLGNIYVSEALFCAGLSPTRMAATVTGAKAERLARCIRDVLARAIEAGGSTLRDHRQATGELGYFQHQFSVYDREGEPCPGCTCNLAKTGGIQRIVQSGRSTFYCSHRQR
ncbi:bifunctional DNA-formamidopyrimidine glycosylase/DNA-(apurinic or apyrimidinic site) lyase [Azospirillum sp. TSO22-1]|uniref:bifunctional DNA-formamidopyrimidine glycosylase/DNA-(apurinic or apyrimidinic site) lyase n=1 Tax=Azospirillum sp. TSO22-1 TaxID=716789 RepID=UPI000D611BDE|nr:bifunctional DNA-formamidopyrimidine glycosylase/DNA-(apurinic or apyrimidinic site) lyase [Azospirillum sp. TSO22-1]PWC44846.1 5-hydroxymethyluracil DNA glycosylase [Azospirillum sp. TSO22-1]